MKQQKILCCQSGCFQASEPGGKKSGACSPFAGWQSPGSLCRAQLAAEKPTEGNLIGVSAWRCPPEAAGLWVQAVASLNFPVSQISGCSAVMVSPIFKISMAVTSEASRAPP